MVINKLSHVLINQSKVLKKFKRKLFRNGPNEGGILAIM